MNYALLKLWLIVGLMWLILLWGLLTPMPPILLGFLMLLVLALAIFLFSILLEALRIRGAVLSLAWRRRLQTIREFSWVIWVVRVALSLGIIWFTLHQAYTGVVLMIMLFGFLGFIKVFIRHHLAKWSTP